MSSELVSSTVNSAHGLTPSRVFAQVYVVPSVWGPDPLSIETRGCFGLTAVHKLDHDQEQVRFGIETVNMRAYCCIVALNYMQDPLLEP